MIAHVSVEISRELAGECTRFYQLLGFSEIKTPEELAERAIWLERGGAQLHLLFSVRSRAKSSAHFALVTANYEEIFAALEMAGHGPESRKQYWGAPRAYVRDPAGNLVEFMAAAP